MGRREAKSKAAKKAPVSSPASLSVRARGALSILGKHPSILLSIAGYFAAGGVGVLAMVVARDYAPIVVGFFIIAGLFGLWGIFKLGTASDRMVARLLTAYIIMALSIASSLSWWISTPAIAKTITLQALILFDPGNPPSQYDLSGNIFFRHLWPPIIPRRLVQGQSYTFHFLINHDEPGSTISGELWIYPSKGIEVDKNLGWGAVLYGNATHHHLIEFDSIPHGRPHVIRAFSFKGTRHGWTTIKYEIHAIATDAKGNTTPAGVVSGRFLQFS